MSLSIPCVCSLFMLSQLVAFKLTASKHWKIEDWNTCGLASCWCFVRATHKNEMWQSEWVSESDRQHRPWRDKNELQKETTNDSRDTTTTTNHRHWHNLFWSLNYTWNICVCEFLWVAEYTDSKNIHIEKIVSCRLVKINNNNNRMTRYGLVQFISFERAYFQMVEKLDSYSGHTHVQWFIAFWHLTIYEWRESFLNREFGRNQ